MEKGSVVEAFVLDVARAERLVDLTLKPEFINRSGERSSITHTKKKVEHLFPEWQIKLIFFIHILYAMVLNYFLHLVTVDILAFNICFKTTYVFRILMFI